jgi:hypothetical protein
MKAETFVSASTTVDKVIHKSNVTIDWTGMSDDEMQALAQRSIIIRKQNADRTNGVIPLERYTIKATDYKIGMRAVKTPLTLAEVLAALPADQREQAIREALAKL